MSLQTLPASFGKGGSNLTDGTLHSVLKELQGLNVTVVAGAAAGTKMNVAAMRTEDTIMAAVVSTDAGGALANDVANCTIQDTKAFGTITVSGNPVADETFVVNGKTYTFKNTITAGLGQVKITAGQNNTMAAAIAQAINAYEARLLNNDQGYNTPQVVAVANAAVVTVTAVVDGAAGNAITLTENATNVAVTGSGTLTSGTDTGGFKSTTNLTGKSVTLHWYNKQ